MKIRSFRLRILLVLLGSVSFLITITLLSVSFFVRREIMSRSERDLAQAHAVFITQQKQRFVKLAEVCQRLLGSRRLAAAMEEGDNDVLAGVAQNELEISKLQQTFMAILNQRGEILLQGWNGDFRTRALPADSALKGFVAGARPDGQRMGPFVNQGRILEAVCMPVRTEGETLGKVVVAFPVTDETAKELAFALGALASNGSKRPVEVGFTIDGKLVASTIPMSARRQLEPLLRAHRKYVPIEVTWEETPYVAFLSDFGGPAQQVVLFSQESLQVLLAQLRGSTVLCGAVMILFCLWLSAILSRGISRPVAELAAASRAIQKGELEVRVQPRTADEIGRLAEAFNEMAEGLQLKEKYRGVLDKVVSPEVAEELLSGKIDLGGELRSVTVLFCDIRGFTKMTEGMKPQEVLELLNRHMTAMTEIVRGHGGIVDKFVGDELMAVFGAPKSTGNDARDALQAAVEMRAARDRLKGNEPEDRKFEIGFGVNTGEVVAGNMGSDKQLGYTVLGKTVNLASRLCKAAAPGKILASAKTIEAAGQSVRSLPLESMDVKGFSEPIPVFEVKGVA